MRLRKFAKSPLFQNWFIKSQFEICPLSLSIIQFKICPALKSSENFQGIRQTLDFWAKSKNVVHFENERNDDYAYREASRRSDREAYMFLPDRLKGTKMTANEPLKRGCFERMNALRREVKKAQNSNWMLLKSKHDRQRLRITRSMIRSENEVIFYAPKLSRFICAFSNDRWNCPRDIECASYVNLKRNHDLTQYSLHWNSPKFCDLGASRHPKGHARGDGHLEGERRNMLRLWSQSNLRDEQDFIHQSEDTQRLIQRRWNFWMDGRDR